MMRVANYYRVSTQLQEKKFSLAAQKEELNRYVKQQGWHLVSEFKDVESGGNLDKEGLNALLDTVEDGKIDVVLVIDQDRLSRLDTVAWEFLKTTLRDNDVKIAEPGNVIDLSNEDDEFISDIKNLIARREKKSIVRRMMRGKRQRLREGKGWGQAPFEYEYNKNTGKYEALEEWRWVIPFIDDLYLNEQIGMYSIMNRLNEVSRTPTGKKWNTHLVSTRLTSKAFHGIQEKEFEDGEVISTPGIFEPLRTEETYNRITEERRKRGEQYSVAGRKTTNNIHMLKRTNITCGLCGRKIYLQQRAKKHSPTYQLFHGRKKKFDGETCRIFINTKRFDNQLLTALKEILTSEELARKYIQIDHDEESISKLKKEIERLEKVINDLKLSQDKLLDLYLIGNQLSKEKYLSKEKEINNRLDVETDQLNKLKVKLNAIDTSSFTYENLYQYMSIASEIDKELTNLQKAQLVGTLFPRGVLYEDKIVLITEVFNNIPVEVNIPIGPPLKNGHVPQHQ